MKNRMIWVTVAAVFLSGSYALAQESLIEHLVNACENDIANYCSQVTPGDGRLFPDESHHPLSPNASEIEKPRVIAGF